MKGYRKIGSGDITVDLESMQLNDNYEMDCQIRGTVHSSLIDCASKTGCSEYRVIIYKKV